MVGRRETRWKRETREEGKGESGEGRGRRERRRREERRECRRREGGHLLLVVWPRSLIDYIYIYIYIYIIARSPIETRGGRVAILSKGSERSRAVRRRGKAVNGQGQ